MHDGTLTIAGKARSLSLVAVTAAILLLCVSSARTLAGAYCYGKIDRILNDRPDEEHIVIKDLSADTVPAYREAIGTIETAVLFDPSRALYTKTLSDVHARFADWAETMELMNAALPEGLVPSAKAVERAAADIRIAIGLQPLNPDNHLALGHLSRAAKDTAHARRHYERAVSAYPVNSALRYSVITEYLAAGLHEDAQAQAIELARLDDSYKIADRAQRRSAREQRKSAYMGQLYGSYLFKAFEVIWRTSNRDVGRLSTSVPDNDEARDVYELFMESKGID